MTAIYSVGLGGSPPTAGRPPARGQWTNITVVGTASGGSDGASASSDVLASVALPMPDSLQFGYGADWNADSTSDVERAVAGARDVANGVSDMSVSGGLLGGLENRILQMGMSTGFRKTLSDSGVAFNPHKEMFYGGPQFRSFPMQWTLSFASRKEHDQFELMVQSLLEHMHPEYRDGLESGVWKIPESFSIKFENAKVRRVDEAVLTSLVVDYAASGAGWKAHHDGAPAHVGLSMSFLELAPLTREKIREGY